MREQTSFAWWAHTLAQRVWVAPPREFQGVELSSTTLHIETDLLADVPFSEGTWSRLAGVNQFATLASYVADTAKGTIRLHSSVSLTSENWLLARAIALHAMALQMADRVCRGAGAGGGIRRPRCAATPHPRQGLRGTSDEMVGILEIYQQRGDERLPFTADEIAELVHLEPRPWTMAANELHRLDANLEFATNLRHEAGRVRTACIARQRPARCGCSCR